MTPILETPRLRMRGHRSDDLGASLAMWSTPAVYRYTSGKPATREDCRARLLRFAGHWALEGYGYWLVEERASGAFVGEVGFSDFMRDMTPSIEGTMEAGWVLSPAHHRKGYGHEAVTAAIAWARLERPLLPMTCLIHPDNAASIGLARKCGFVPRCRAVYRGEEELLMDWVGPEGP